METITAVKPDLKSLYNLVGNTPLHPIERVFQHPTVKLYAKLEWMQLAGSVKCRPAYYIFKDAIERGKLGAGQTLLDASSGNTAIAYATIGAALNIPVAICLPENASAERQQILKGLGVELILTSKFGGTDDAQKKARELTERDPGRYYYADQYNNEWNWKSHYLSTAEEIYQQTGGGITHLVVGLGTTGTAMGTFMRLRELTPDIKLVTLQPDLAMHQLEGWKHMETAIVPGIYDSDLAAENLEIDSREALDMMNRIARLEGLMVSPSAAANLVGALKVAHELDEGVVVTVFPDDVSKYLDLMDRP